MEGGKMETACPDCMGRLFRLEPPMRGYSVWRCEKCGKQGFREDFERRVPEGAMVVAGEEKAEGTEVER